ncbi:putative uncharacterized protein DDB_G0282133 isoform X1 [Condylostylus longicornis]|uniref:putative uncharacterized protein DDB_G0282133 isoform X1 n=1 Tax=Condylostylus longicornis TaxID=2530218 RepID=UPI00244DD680|nr:putative uncharacterized protein DDB_G0282133 isoform X1 [Condylostylus longicornis]XP_055381140.1 putative uncharacterized protein DDB_G0282133 isoform X1 [Condylostylus longicornis]
MANPIPPLVCSTPPPIDDFDEVSQIDDRTDTDYGEYEANTDVEFGSFEGPSLPNTPRHINISDIITEDRNNSSSECDIKNVEGSSSQNVTSDEIESFPIEISEEDVVTNIEKISLKEAVEENDDSISIEIAADEEKGENESNVRQPDPYECRWEKYESPPSLELSLQVVSEENDSCEKISNDGKDLDKFDNDEQSISKYESLASKEDSVEISITDGKLPEKATIEFQDFLKDTLVEHVLNKVEVTSSESDIGRNIDSCEAISPKKIEDENIDKSCVLSFTQTYNIHENESEFNSPPGCEMINSELIGNSVPADNLVFEADFSQFENALPLNATIKTEDSYFICENEIEKSAGLSCEKIPSIHDLKLGNENFSSSLDDNIENRFSNLNTISKVQIDLETEKIDDFDEEFGEFSDFKDASITATNYTMSKVENEKMCNPQKTETVSSILDSMFPPFENCSDNGDKNDSKSIRELAENYSILTNYDSANALGYQWSSSNTRHSLIKSLGIDSRNILYGEKWNCSMPKFASNLGFTPLEPLKPAKVDSKSQQLSNSVISNSCNGTNKHNPIPDAEFDWNSSGLINPLDASHAHTLLLDYDLDQLVVVANLDNIKLDSYSSYLFTSSSSASTSTSTLLPTTSYCTTNTFTTTNGSVTTTCPPLNYFEHRWVNNINCDNNITTDTTLGNGTIQNFSNNSTCLNSHALNNNNFKNVLMEFGSKCHYGEIANQINKKNYNINTVMNATNATTNNNYDIILDYSLSSRSKKQFEEKQNIEIHTTANEPGEVDSSTEPSKIEDESAKANVSTKYEIGTEKILNDIEFIGSLSSSHNENSSTEFAAYPTAPSEPSNDDDDSSAKSKTTSIDIELPTLSKTTSTSGEEKLPVVDISLGSSTISINSKPIFSTNTPNQLSINENTSKLNENFIKQLNSYSNDYLNMGPPPTTYVVPLKETHIFTPTKSDNPISQSTGGDFRSTCSQNSNINNSSGGIVCSLIETVDFDYESAAAGTKINEKVIKKEYHDIEYDPGKFGLKPIDLQLADNIGINNAQNKSKDAKISDNNCLDINDLEENTNSATSWTFDLKNCTNETEKSQPLGSDVLNNDRSSPNPTIFSSNQPIKTQTTDIFTVHHHNESVMPSDITVSNKKFVVDFENITNAETTNLEKTQNFGSTDFKEISSSLSKNNCDNFDDEFTDFQSVLPSLEYKNNFADLTRSSCNFNQKHEDKSLDINSTSISASFKENDKSRNQTPTLPCDDRMILSPAILLPQSVSVSHSSCLNETPKIEWPQPGISNDDLARLENFFPQMKSSPVTSMDNTSNNDDDWSDFMSVPPQSNLTLQNNPSPKIVHNESNLNIIYNPQSPTKVSSKRTTSHLNNSHDEDEWSDFISSAPVSSNLGNPNSNMLPGNQHQWNNIIKPNNCLATGQQYHKHNNIFVPSQQQEKQYGYLNSNNNKISQYLLNNTSAGQTDNHINSGSNNMQLNSLKPNDFIPHHHLQHQVLQKQQKILTQSTNNGSNIIGNNISFIPDLGFSSPQNQFINITKRNYQRK